MVSFDDGVFGTSNYGNAWLTYEIGAYSGNYQSVAIDPISPNIAYVGSAAEVYKTEDDGQTWQMTPGFPITGLPDNYWVHPIFLAIHPLTHTTVYAGVSYFTKSSEIINDGGLYRSDDGADSWVRITTTGPITPVSRITWAPGHPEILYLGTGTDCHLGKGNGIWRSRDSGQTWEHPDQLRGLSVPVLAVHPDNPDFLLAGVWCGMDNDQGIYWSDDAGNSWHLTTGLNSWDERRVSDIAYDPIDPGIIYAATVGGLRISFDGGNSWQAYPGPMGRLPVTALTLVQDGGQTRLYIGTVGGATSGQLSTLAGARPESAQILGGGVYTGQPRWHSVYLPLVRNKAQ